MADKLKATQGPDRMLLITGLLFVIATFLPWYKLSFKAGLVSTSGSGNAWKVGGTATLAGLLGWATLIFAVVVIAGVIKSSPSFGTISLVLAGGTLLFTLLRFLFKPGSGLGSTTILGRTVFTITRGFGLWAALVLAVLMTVAAFQKYSASSA
jgi:hypothetical protein